VPPSSPARLFEERLERFADRVLVGLAVGGEPALGVVVLKAGEPAERVA
jgi:hypothetical protein